MTLETTMQGTLKRLVYHNEETHFVVAQLEEGHRISGILYPVNIGDLLEFVGQWIEDPRYGRQFRFTSAKSVIPADRQGMIRYLGQARFANIGMRRAEELVDAFGEQLFEVMEHDPQQLTRINGITEKRALQIQADWLREKAQKDVMLYLSKLNLTPRQSSLIFAKYREETISQLQQNPYQMVDDIDGFGFLTADGIAQRIGIPVDSLYRAKAGVLYVLYEAGHEGHTYLPLPKLHQRAARRLAISVALIDEAIVALVEDQRLVVSDGRVASKNVHDKELYIAKKLWDLLAASHEAGDAGSVESFLTRQQRLAVELVCRYNVVVITGLPGTGKTTSLRSVLNAFMDQSVELAAPTGKAAKRMSESTGREARTLHRLLEFNPIAGGFTRNEDNPLEADLIVIDEVSMVDVDLFDALLHAVEPGTKMALVGDADQLPSVGAGNILADLLASSHIPQARLTEIMRQAADSLIVTNAHAINRGSPIIKRNEEGSDFFFIEEDDPARMTEEIVRFVATTIPEYFGYDPIREIQVLCPMRKGAVGIVVLNGELQRMINPRHPEKREIRVHDSLVYREGDRVMQIVNNYRKVVFNGDSGVIRKIEKDRKKILVDFTLDQKDSSQPASKTTSRNVGFANYADLGIAMDLSRFDDDWDLTEYSYAELNQLQHAFACTVHKSQGSEYPCVVMPLHMGNAILLARNLLYTAVTRGKELVVLVGSQRALEYAIENNRPAQRFTQLRRFLGCEV